MKQRPLPVRFVEIRHTESWTEVVLDGEVLFGNSILTGEDVALLAERLGAEVTWPQGSFDGEWIPSEEENER